MEKEIILGLDVSTSCIGICLFINDGEKSEIIKLTHIKPKIKSKIKGIESLFIKKQIFENEFIIKEIIDKNLIINKVIIEEPLLGSNNINTVATLLRFNGMISDSVYRLLGLVPEYISSYDARKYAFPELMSIRKFNKKGEIYPLSKIKSGINKMLKYQEKEDIKDNCLSLFGEYPWDIDKKQIVWDKIDKMFPKIEWVYDKDNELRKENFDSTDAVTVILSYINIQKYGKYYFKISDINITIDKINYNVIIENNNKISHQLLLK